MIFWVQPLLKLSSPIGQFVSRNFISSCDVVVVGGGIVGVSTARELARSSSPNNHKLNIVLVEKESFLGAHQSSHNSGVIHAGVYYTPGSIRAKLCTKGMKLAYQYFEENSVPFKKTGKLIVATSPSQVPGLHKLYQRALQNEVPDVRLIEGSEIKSIEPHCQGVQAIHSPHTGIVDWGYVTKLFGKDLESSGGIIQYNFEVVQIAIQNDDTEHPVILRSHDGKELRCSYVLCCGGLHADRLAKLSGGSSNPPVIPVRGEYLLLDPSKSHLVKGNIYPVPDARFPFLGVHFTPRMDGSIWVGPNAVLATAREGYRYRDFNTRDFVESISNRGFQKLALKYYDFGIKETMKSVFKKLALKDLQNFIPQLKVEDLRRGPSGVRAQAISESGDLIEDFVFEEMKGDGKTRVLHCRNAPSPAATSSLAIAQVLAEKMINLMKS